MKTSIHTRLKSNAALIAICSAAVMAPSTAQAGDIGVSASVDYVSEYVFRGVSFANTSIQPGVEVSKGNFTVGVWSSSAIGSTSAAAGDEIDFYGSYGFDVNDTISASVGATVYHFPGSDDLFSFDSDTLGSTFEANAGVSFNTILSPSVTGYYDFTLEAFTLEGSVGHSLPVADKVSVDLGLTGGFVSADGPGDYEWATGSASLGYAFTDDTAFYVGANFSVNSEDLLDFVTSDAEIIDFVNTGNFTTDDTVFWFGTGFSTNF